MAGTELRIDELARLAGTTVRNVRVYQERGLLPSPRRQGRVGIYDDSHLARLRLIGSLLERGFTMANIAELLRAWAEGRGLAEVMGLEEAVGGPWSDEVPGYLTYEELAARFGGADDAALQRAIELEFVVPEGDRLRVPSPRLLHAGAELYAAGVPLDAILDHARELRDDVDRIAARFVALAAAHVWEPYVAGGSPAEEIPRLTEAFRRLRPLAEMATAAALARAMEHYTLALIGDQMARLLALLPHDEAS